MAPPDSGREGDRSGRRRTLRRRWVEGTANGVGSRAYLEPDLLAAPLGFNAPRRRDCVHDEQAPTTHRSRIRSDWARIKRRPRVYDLDSYTIAEHKADDDLLGLAHRGVLERIGNQLSREQLDVGYDLLWQPRGHCRDRRSRKGGRGELRWESKLCLGPHIGGPCFRRHRVPTRTLLRQPAIPRFSRFSTRGLTASLKRNPDLFRQDCDSPRRAHAPSYRDEPWAAEDAAAVESVPQFADRSGPTLRLAPPRPRTLAGVRPI